MSDTAIQIKAIDSIQDCLANYTSDLDFHHLSSEVVHAAKVRVIDTFGALYGGFFGEPCCIARNLATQMRTTKGATIIGTNMKVTLNMAAFVNATTARYIELNDVYHFPGSLGGHPSDVLTPVFGVAEYTQADGRSFITALVLAYEIYLRFSDAVDSRGFDCTTFSCLSTALATGKLLGLSRNELRHCLSMAAVSNNILRQVRSGPLSMWKAVAAGQGGQAGVFSALLASAGMEGPHLPFEGKAGWCNSIARKRLSFDTLGGGNNSFKILDTMIKRHSSCANTISSALAAEKIGRLTNLGEVKRVIVETYSKAKEGHADAAHHWNPDSREAADHSIPYVTAVALMDGMVTPRQFDDAHLSNPELHDFIQKIEVVTNDDFSDAYRREPLMHCTRVTLESTSGERLVGESGGDKGDLSGRQTDAQIIEKFRYLSEQYLGAKRVTSLLDQIWNLEDSKNIAELTSALSMI